MLRLTLFGENGSHTAIAVLDRWKERNIAFGLIHNRWFIILWALRCLACSWCCHLNPVVAYRTRISVFRGSLEEQREGNSVHSCYTWIQFLLENSCWRSFFSIYYHLKSVFFHKQNFRWWKTRGNLWEMLAQQFQTDRYKPPESVFPSSPCLQVSLAKALELCSFFWHYNGLNRD